MGRISKHKKTILLVIITFMIAGCANISNINFLKNTFISKQVNEGSEQSKEGRDFWGVWRIDEVVLTSEMYTGTTKDGDLEVDLYDPEDYIGMEVEYSFDFFRFEDQIYDNPEYIVKYVSVEEFQNGGDFRLPDLYGLIEEKQIKVNKSDEYNNLSETPLLCFDIAFASNVQYDIYSFVPIGTQGVLLSNDTMLIGVWGKILLAHKN